MCRPPPIQRLWVIRMPPTAIHLSAIQQSWSHEEVVEVARVIQVRIQSVPLERSDRPEVIDGQVVELEEYPKRLLSIGHTP